MGEAKRRKLLDTNYGKSGSVNWKQYSVNQDKFPRGDDSNKLPDFGQLVYNQLGNRPITVKLFEDSYNPMSNGNDWFISFFTQTCAITPSLMLKEVYVGTLELGAVGKQSALATAERFREGLPLRARHDLRYWSEKTQELVVPFELA